LIACWCGWNAVPDFTWAVIDRRQARLQVPLQPAVLRRRLLAPPPKAVHHVRHITGGRAATVLEDPPVTSQPDLTNADRVFRNAARAAVKALYDDGVNASTVLMPSGAGTVLIGLRVILEAVQRERPFRALVVLPESLVKSASNLYREKAGDALAITNVEYGRTGLHDLEVALSNVAAGLVVLCSYGDLLEVNMAQRNSRIGPLNLIVLEMAQLVRAGGYREAGMKDDMVSSKKRLYISSRHLAGQAPGALLAPGQESNYPKEQNSSRFGPEVYRLTHEDAAKLKLIVPVRLSFLKSTTSLRDTAVELAGLHRDLGIRKIAMTKAPRSLAHRLDIHLRNLTQGACRAVSAAASQALDIDAVVVAGAHPDYGSIAQEFARLAQPSPGKRLGLVLVCADAIEQVVAAWRAVAIENFDVEEAISLAAVACGKKDERLSWKEIPPELRRFIYQDTPEAEAETAVARCIRELGDPWDAWFGRLKAWQEKEGINRDTRFADIFGFKLGQWLWQQRFWWKNGFLSARKVAALRAQRIMLDEEEETFHQGIAELRKYVKLKQTNRVPLSVVTESGFALGKWVVEMRNLHRHRKLSQDKVELLKDAFFVWRPAEMPASYFSHPEDPDAAVVTRSLEEELRKLRWRPLRERRRHFRKLVLTHHPDVSEDEHADSTIKFLADVKDWFLAGS